MEPKRAGNGPIVAELEPGKTYYWCACGESNNQPFCDGSHKQKGVFSPIKIVVEEPVKKALCVCKQSGNKPFCDGTHRK